VLAQGFKLPDHSALIQNPSVASYLSHIAQACASEYLEDEWVNSVMQAASKSETLQKVLIPILCPSFLYPPFLFYILPPPLLNDFLF